MYTMLLGNDEAAVRKLILSVSLFCQVDCRLRHHRGRPEEMMVHAAKEKGDEGLIMMLSVKTRWQWP